MKNSETSFLIITITTEQSYISIPTAGLINPNTFFSWIQLENLWFIVPHLSGQQVNPWSHPAAPSWLTCNSISHLSSYQLQPRENTLPSQ